MRRTRESCFKHNMALFNGAACPMCEKEFASTLADSQPAAPATMPSVPCLCLSCSRLFPNGGKCQASTSHVTVCGGYNVTAPAAGSPGLPCEMHNVAGGCRSAMFGHLACGDAPCHCVRPQKQPPAPHTGGPKLPGLDECIYQSVNNDSQAGFNRDVVTVNKCYDFISRELRSGA